MPQAIIAHIAGALFTAGFAMTAIFVAKFGTLLILAGGMAYSANRARKAKRDARDQFNAAQVDRMVNISSALAPRELVMGRVRKGGAVFYRASTGTNLKDLYVAIALAGHEIDAVESIYLNDVLVTLDGSGFAITDPYNATITTTGTTTFGGPYTATLVADSIQTIYVQSGEDPVASGNVSYQYTTAFSNAQIFTHLGAAGQTASPELLAAFPVDWVSANTVEGCAYLVAKFTYSETSFPSGVPNVTAVIRGAKLFDPRDSTTVWSENPALMMRHVYAHAKFGKATITAAEDVRFTAAANACDTSTVYTVASVAQDARALYKASIVLPFGGSAESAFDDLSQAMGGSWAFAGGEIYLKAGVFTASVMTMVDADLAVIQRSGASETQSPIKISVHRERAAKFNTVKVSIWDHAQDYKQVALTPLVGSALLTRDGVELVQEISYPAIGYAPQALHVAGIMMRDARDPLTIELPFKLRAYPLELFDTVAVTLSRYGWTDKTFMILGRTWDASGALMLTLKETTASITQMDAGFSAQGFASNTNLPDPWLVEKVGALAFSSGTAELIKQLDGTVTSRMRITWPASTDISVTQAGRIEVQYRLSDSTGAWASLFAQGDDTQVVTSEVEDNKYYLIRARAKTTLAISDWNLQVQHQVLGKSELPPAFDTFLVLAQPDGTRQYNFSYTGAAPVDWAGGAIRYLEGTHASPDWDAMTLLQDGKTYYTASPVEINAPLSGTYTFAVKSVDTSGLFSAYLLKTITLGARRIGSVFDEFFEHTEGWTGTKTGCQLQDGILQSIDTTTWATAPATWADFTRWNFAPTSPIYYETPGRDLGAQIVGGIDSTSDADGTVVIEIATSTDGATWSGWSDPSAQFNSRYIKLRISVTATGPLPVPVIRTWSYVVTSPLKTEYLNDVDISALTGSFRIGVGDIRIPLVGVYTVIKHTTVTIQDSAAGAWVATRIDQTLTYGPRWQFRYNGTLTDPALVDFLIEGF